MSKKKKHRHGRRGNSFKNNEHIRPLDPPRLEPNAMRYPDVKKKLIDDVKSRVRRLSDYGDSFYNEQEINYFQARIGGYNDAIEDIVQLLTEKL